MSAIGMLPGAHASRVDEGRAGHARARNPPALLLNAFTLLADSKVRQRTPAMAECAGILSQANRLAARKKR